MTPGIGEGCSYFSVLAPASTGVPRCCGLPPTLANTLASFLNDFLQRVEIEPGKQAITKLLVNWERVGGILGGSTALHVLFGLAALLYCQQNWRWGHVPSFASMFTFFTFSSEEEI